MAVSRINAPAVCYGAAGEECRWGVEGWGRLDSGWNSHPESAHIIDPADGEYQVHVFPFMQQPDVPETVTTTILIDGQPLAGAGFTCAFASAAVNTCCTYRIVRSGGVWRADLSGDTGGCAIPLGTAWWW